MDLAKTFKEPGNEFRGKPFWAWNGTLEPEELRRQIRVFARMGLGGFFMHSRVGLATPYLGEPWFECIGACEEEARRLGLEAWLYDEDRWPSGAAGGLATADPRFRQRILTMKVAPAASFSREPGTLGMWQGRVDGERIVALERLSRPRGKAHGSARNAVPSGSGRGADQVLSFAMETAPESSWYNDATYLDVLSPEAVREFIRVTHEAYSERFGKEFGKAIPGIFTDEPNFSWSRDENEVAPGHALAWLPWTPGLPRAFEARYGYSVIDHLPELFFDTADGSPNRVRYHFYDCLTQLFTDSFSRQIGEWCGRHKLRFTGHVLCEQPLTIQAKVVGSAMRFYEHMQAPGIDLLTQFWPEYDTAKQCASVLNQTGRTWMLSELYGCTGWDFPFEGHKALGDWQAALGVNVRCQHLSWYTMSGEAKRDYPASISYQSAWWPHYRLVEDYFARIGAVMSQGRPVRRLLVIHPIESVWLELKPPLYTAKRPTMDVVREMHQDLDDTLVTLRNWLLGAHIDFDYADEEMLGRLGGVRASGADHGASLPRVKVGKADYDAVLVPPLRTIRSSTLRLLKRFAAAGGSVVFAGEPAPACDAEISSAAARIADQCRRVAFEAPAVIEAVQAARRVSVAGRAGGEAEAVLHMLREDGGRRMLFLCNTDRARGAGGKDGAVEIAVQAKGQVSEWDPVSGERFATPARAEGGWLRFATELPPSGSRLFVIEPGAHRGLKPRPRWAGERRVTLNGVAPVQLDEANVLVLDRPRFCIGGGRWQGPMEILRVDSAIRDSLGLPRRGAAMVQPWARTSDGPGPSAPVELRYTIQIDALPAGPVELILETPERFAITLNGEALTVRDGAGWWADPCLKRVAVNPAQLRLGENELRLAIDFIESDGLEAAFLAGDFGVSVDGAACRVIEPVRRLKAGDWVAQGLPFYGASVIYRYRIRPETKRGEAVFVSFPEFKATVLRVHVNGREAGLLGWPPYELELTPWLGEAARDGEIELAVEVVASRRNSFGPLHQTNLDPPWISSTEFMTTGADWSEAYRLKPSGLLRAPELVYRKAKTIQ